MKVTFLGGARTVTGSMHLVETARSRVLLECGLFQGHRDEAERINRQVPRAAVEADFMILSHSHIDHSGNIPNLVKSGFAHEIYTTGASCDITELLLKDSAHIQEADLTYLNKTRARDHLPPIEPIYTVDDAEASLKYLSSLTYEQRFERGDVAFTLFDAGHILGSGQVVLENDGRKLVFTGDLGRSNLPIINDPVQLREADYLIIESTYGGRLHPPFAEVSGQLAAIINRVVARKGRIVIPAFALGRTQEIIYTLRKLIDAKAIPEIPTFVDSPLASGITELFRKHEDYFDAEAQQYIVAHHDMLSFGRLKLIESQADSMKLNDLTEPCIIISASGMAENGRILHHLKYSVTDPRNCILIVGFAAQYTLARRIRDHESPIRIFGEEYPLRAEVQTIDAFSAHADQAALVSYVEGLNKARLKKVFLVHGELDQSEALQNVLAAKGYDVAIPEKGQTVTL